ncbi:MAG: glycosyltransferase family 2 protein [Caldilineaceae bacterium]|nr:glycosyltransferase family 2 protein [Caldilineaceae bacterium]
MSSPASSSACDLSIVIVSWNVADLLVACLASIARGTRPHPTNTQWRILDETTAAQSTRPPAPPDPEAPAVEIPAVEIPAVEIIVVEVIVVDNASHDDSVARVEAVHPWVKVIQAGANLGFTAGNNLGYAHSQGEFVYFLNPDTEILADLRHGNSLAILLDVIARAPDVGMVGPQLRYADNTRQNSRRRFPTRWTGFFESTWLGAALPANPWARRLHMDDWPTDFIHDVDWLVGAAMLARRTALEMVRLPGTVGPFDEGFFMYSEEVDLCRRIKQAGWRILYVPAARVVHYEGRSSEQVVAARHIHFNTSKVRYYRKYFGPRWAGILRRYLLLEYGWQIWLERAKRLLGSRRAMRAARIAAYQEVRATRLLPATDSPSPRSR